MVLLIDTRATHNFIDASFVKKRGLQREEHEGFRVMVAIGHKILSTQMIPNLHMLMGDYDMEGKFYVVDIGDYDVILGMTWMRSLVEFTFNLEKIEMRFKHQDHKVVLRGLSNGGLTIVSLKRMEHFFRHDQVEWATKCMIMPIVTEKQLKEYHPSI